jgi:small-conductance mechanosensitive channel
MWRGLLAIILTAFLINAVPAFAVDAALVVNAEHEAAGLRSDLERAQGVLAQDNVTDDQLTDQRNVLEKLRSDAVAESAKLSLPLKDVQQQLNQLGPAPTNGLTEPDTIATQRQLLVDTSARLTAAQKQFDLVILETDQTSAKVSGLQRDQFFQRIFRPDKSIFNPQLWQDAATGAALFGARVVGLISVWWEQQAPQANFFGLLVIPAAFIAVWFFYRVLNVSFAGWLPKRSDALVPLSPLRRLWRVIWGALGIGVGLSILALTIEVSLALSGLATQRLDLLTQALFGVIAPTAFQFGLAWLIASPRNPQARLIAVDNSAARNIPIFTLLAAFIQSFTAQVTTLSSQLLLPLSMVAGQSAFSSAVLIGLAGLMLVLVRRQASSPPAIVPEPHYLTWFISLMPLVWLLLFVASGALLFGYIALAWFIAGKILDTILVIVMMMLVHHLADAFADTLTNPGSLVAVNMRRITGWGDRGLARLALIIRTFADVMLVVIGVPWLMALWTVTWVDFRSLFNSIAGGFKFGNVSIAPGTILSLISVLILGIFVTRFVSSWLDRRVLSQTEMHKGVKDSIHTGTNYLGYALAIAFALSSAGVDFSSIALVAGALGVGIGFGLQSIVNNLVSGLILLAERPLRVGDWIVTRTGEGIVRKINVRATEIETFDNCTIIVPNSNLVTEPVKNWTHRDTLGRFNVLVGVKHGTDVDLVAKTLEEVAKAHTKVMRYPPPIIHLARFAPQFLEFEVGGQVADVFEAANIASDIRFAIVRAFKEKGIVIPDALDMLEKKN